MFSPEFLSLPHSPLDKGIHTLSLELPQLPGLLQPHVDLPWVRPGNAWGTGSAWLARALCSEIYIYLNIFIFKWLNRKLHLYLVNCWKGHLSLSPCLGIYVYIFIALVLNRWPALPADPGGRYFRATVNSPWFSVTSWPSEFYNKQHWWSFLSQYLNMDLDFNREALSSLHHWAVMLSYDHQGEGVLFVFPLSLLRKNSWCVRYLVLQVVPGEGLVAPVPRLKVDLHLTQKHISTSGIVVPDRQVEGPVFQLLHLHLILRNTR